ncbi:hypothetical protein OPT61_g7359 [Boeremia exigua]|uniref:Uncharacterized protein n=1 Tax=Boeremia exigua TaxID=749465 RepID=A0ACC2I3V7_9PLEO|nr:hypothetical protein OPT61_g7359 [Boeremia exigua]
MIATAAYTKRRRTPVAAGYETQAVIAQHSKKNATRADPEPGVPDMHGVRKVPFSSAADFQEKNCKQFSLPANRTAQNNTMSNTRCP